MADFIKTINYCVNLILNQQNQMKITQFIEISPQEGEKLTDLTLSLINTLITFNVNTTILDQKIKLLRLDKQKTEFLKNKINDNMYELRKIVYDSELNNISKIQQLNWRVEIEVASKTCKNLFNPNIFLHLKLKNSSQQESQNYAMNCNFGNLTNLQYQLNQAIKIHHNPKYKVARNSSI